MALAPRSTQSGMPFLRFSPGLTLSGPSAWQSPPGLAFSEQPDHSPVTWAQVTLGTYLGTVHSLGCLPWQTMASEGGAWSVLNPRTKNRLVHRRCSVYIAE